MSLTPFRFLPAESLIVRRSSAPHMPVRDLLKRVAGLYLVRYSPCRYLHCRHRYWYSRMALQHCPHPVFRSFVSNLAAWLSKRLSNTPLSEDLPGSSGSAVLQVISLPPTGSLNGALTWKSDHDLEDRKTRGTLPLGFRLPHRFFRRPDRPPGLFPNCVCLQPR